MRKARKLLSVVLALVLAASMLPAALATGEETTQITILGTSDMHSDIWGFDYANVEETEGTGMARLYTYIQQVREENPNTILVDGGDDIQGTIMSDDIFNKNPDRDHPVVAAMNFMGYDAMTLGNHEFNWGIKDMQAIMGQAEFPVLCANVTDKDGELVTGEGWTIVEKGGVKLAIIGVTSPSVPRWDGGKEGIDDCTYEDASEAVKKAIEEIGDQADLILVSAHMGLEAEYYIDEDDRRDSAAKILEVNPEVDVLQVAHTHSTVNEKVGEVPVAGVRSSGVEIARFDLTLDKDKNIVDTAVEIVSMEDVEPSEEIRKIETVAAAHEEAVKFINEDVLGSTTAKFQPENEIDGIAQGWIEDTAVMDLINTVQLEKSGADVSAAALFKYGSDLPEGDIKYNNIFDIYKYDNTLYRVKLTGAELKEYMEWSAGYYNTWKEGDINISFDPEFRDYKYDMFAGVDYEIDISKPVGERITNLKFRGEDLADDQELTLAVNNYRFSSTVKGMLAAGDEAKEWESSESIRDMLKAYFEENSPVEPKVDNNWKIVGIDLQLDNPQRAEIIAKINAGEIESPKNVAYNLNADADAPAETPAEPETPAESEGNVVLGEKTGTAAVITADGTDYFRLRDVAGILAGTEAAFNVEWNHGVVVTKGGEYSAVDMPESPEAGEIAGITVTVDGEAVELTVVRANNSNYVSAEGFAAILGVEAAVEDGVLKLAA
ncbi:MAG: bifunctional metallophosphatase/5'-nucleotidase [Oscillospiraceae bacterium]|jgi:2',3'-cyclic-nucleotide 2'-phosphodiesterase (5'-nucleotidase family)|nr:bifunctional metallophosphatase/5'-nucleotidase [Oscillospiraceae bacterium]